MMRAIGYLLFALVLACVADVVETSAGSGGSAGAPACAPASHNCEPERPVALLCPEGVMPEGDCIQRINAYCCALDGSGGKGGL